jgi:hypothetical protein
MRINESWPLFASKELLTWRVVVLPSIVWLVAIHGETLTQSYDNWEPPSIEGNHRAARFGHTNVYQPKQNKKIRS